MLPISTTSLEPVFTQRNGVVYFDETFWTWFGQNGKKTI